MKNRIYRKPKIIGWLFIVAIFAEIAGFIIVGKAIGLFATLALLIFCMFLGIILLRLQGISLLTVMQKELAAGRVPSKKIADKALMIFAAILLIIPGFVSDVIGLLLLIAPIRALIWSFFIKKFQKSSFQNTQFYSENDRHKNTNNKEKSLNAKIIDLEDTEYQQEDKQNTKHDSNKNSPWKK